MQPLAPSPRAFDRLIARRIGRLGWARFATFSSALVSVTTLVMMVVVRSGSRGDLDSIAVRALGWASWLIVVPSTLAAISCLSRLRGDARLPRTLASLGVRNTRLELAALLGGVRFVFSRLAIPGFLALFCALLLSRSVGELPSRALQLLAGSVYIVGLAMAAGLASAGASRLGERKGRWLLLLLVLGPMFLSERWFRLVDVPRALDAMLDGILRLGGA
ncbi:MAG: hypothetical protein KC766_32980 [Myxococcales bacterium]|nr:hypothetical protein [Myxococcales bacterium]